MRSLSFALFFFLLAGACAQNGPNLPLDSIPGATVTRSETFTGQSLWGYMDGGADLYLEYGFQNLYLRELNTAGENIRLEVFEMGGPDEAYGIYSLSLSKCLVSNGLSDFSCESRYQAQAAWGPYYISATSSSGSKEAQGLCSQLVSLVIRNNPQDIVLALPPVFRSPGLLPFTGTIRYYQGPLGLQNGKPEWSDLFEGVNFRMFVTDVPLPNINGSLARISFPMYNSLSFFLSNASLDPGKPGGDPVLAPDGLYHSWFPSDNSVILYFESQDTTRILEIVPVNIPDSAFLFPRN